MNLRVREMRAEEAVLVIEYFHFATPEDVRTGGCRAADLQRDEPARPQRSAGRRSRSAIVPCMAWCCRSTVASWPAVSDHPNASRGIP
jgi:hypothetical protein